MMVEYKRCLFAGIHVLRKKAGNVGFISMERKRFYLQMNCSGPVSTRTGILCALTATLLITERTLIMPVIPFTAPGMKIMCLVNPVMALPHYTFNGQKRNRMT